MSKLDQVLAAVDKFESDLGFTAPEMFPMRIDRLRAMVRDVFEDDEDAPGNEPPAKVIVVTEAPVGDKPAVERSYAANQWDDSDYTRLRLLRKGVPVGSYAAGAWLSVREHSATTGDPYYRQGKKLAIALDALREMREHGDEAASEALAAIAELDL